MIKFLASRFINAIIMLWALSLITFVLIQLPPGDALTAHLAVLAAQGEEMDVTEIKRLREVYGLDGPMHIRYFRWISGVLVGDFGQSFLYNRPVGELIWKRLGWSASVEGLAILVTWLVAIPIGIYSAVRKYSLGDYVSTVFGFIGMAIPNFFFALLLMYWSYVYFGENLGGLYSSELEDQPWSVKRVIDFLAHAWAPVLVLATASTAQLIRILRANLLDELSKPYVVTARSKGLSETRLLLKYPLRLALNPVISTLGWLLPNLISVSAVVSVVLNLPTTGSMMLSALMNQDMYLAGAFVLLLGALILFGTFLSDILLAIVDPRIRLGFTEL